MERFLKYLESQDLKVVDNDITLDDGSTSFLHLVKGAHNIKVNVSSKDVASSLVVVGGEGESVVNVTIADGARLNMLAVLCTEAKESIVIDQAKDSRFNLTLLELASSEFAGVVNLDGRGADAEVNMLQLPSGNEKMNISLRIAHNSSDCTSRSTAKCAASGASTGEFHGLVYVAEGAQRTFSEQNSRNVALSADAKIIAEPQLEIYADDVKCTHGATVGQMNQEAILYMRQRGLSEEQAKKLQLDGFIAEVTNSCGIESLRDALSELAREHLQNI